MRFTRFDAYRIVVLFIFTILLGSCSPTVAHKMDNDLGVNESDLEICNQSPENAWFDLQAASVMQTLIGDDKVEALGMDGAQALAGDLYSQEDTFCGLGIQPDLKTALDEIQALYESGDDLQADEALDDLMISIEQGDFSAAHTPKLSAPVRQAGGDATRRVVKNYLDIAGRAAYWGNDDKAESAFQAATETYEKWAQKAVETADVKEALRIAAEAQLLGIEGLDDAALERATDLVGQELARELGSYQPCTATKIETRRLLDTVAKALLLGIDVDTFEIIDLVEEWQTIQKKRQNGEEVPECEGWLIEMVIDETWESGYHYILWEGLFNEGPDGSLVGQGKGTLRTYVEIPCVNVLSGEEFQSITEVSGTFTFKIEGRRVGPADNGTFQFLFPAEVSYSGLDTCNEFDPDTYLPRFVIEEINSAGGVENYDLETDQIYLAIPAQDGAAIEYETIIGQIHISVSEHTSGN